MKLHSILFVHNSIILMMMAQRHQPLYSAETTFDSYLMHACKV